MVNSSKVGGASLVFWLNGATQWECDIQTAVQLHVLSNIKTAANISFLFPLCLKYNL